MKLAYITKTSYGKQGRNCMGGEQQEVTPQFRPHPIPHKRLHKVHVGSHKYFDKHQTTEGKTYHHYHIWAYSTPVDAYTIIPVGYATKVCYCAVINSVGPECMCCCVCATWTSHVR